MSKKNDCCENSCESYCLDGKHCCKCSYKPTVKYSPNNLFGQTIYFIYECDIPLEICRPGTYILAKNITICTPKPAITIKTSKVILDLNNNTITGKKEANVLISLKDDITDIVIKNGCLTGDKTIGINGNKVTNLNVDNVIFVSLFEGIMIDNSFDILIENCEYRKNGRHSVLIDHTIGVIINNSIFEDNSPILSNEDKQPLSRFSICIVLNSRNVIIKNVNTRKNTVTSGAGTIVGIISCVNCKQVQFINIVSFQDTIAELGGTYFGAVNAPLAAAIIASTADSLLGLTSDDVEIVHCSVNSAISYAIGGIVLFGGESVKCLVVQDSTACGCISQQTATGQGTIIEQLTGLPSGTLAGFNNPFYIGIGIFAGEHIRYIRNNIHKCSAPAASINGLLIADTLGAVIQDCFVTECDAPQNFGGGISCRFRVNPDTPRTTDGVIIRNCMVVDNTTRDANSGFRIFGIGDSQITNCIVSRIKSVQKICQGFRLLQNTSSTFLENCSVSDCEGQNGCWSYTFGGGNGITFKNCKSSNNISTAGSCYGWNSIPVELNNAIPALTTTNDIEIENCFANNHVGALDSYGFYLANMKNLVLTKCTSLNNRTTGDTTGSPPRYIGTGYTIVNASSSAIKDNEAIGNQTYGFAISLNEIQKYSITPDAQTITGNYKITFGALTTANIPYTATPDQIRTALEALANIGTNEVYVDYSPDPNQTTTEFVLRFQGALQQTNVSQIIVTDVDGSPTPTFRVGTLANGTSIHSTRVFKNMAQNNGSAPVTTANNYSNTSDANNSLIIPITEYDLSTGLFSLTMPAQARGTDAWDNISTIP